MTFEFGCAKCEYVERVKGRIGRIPKAPYHHSKKMHRLYSIPHFQVGWGISEYVDRAYHGDETVPGMTTQEVRELVDKSFTKQA